MLAHGSLGSHGGSWETLLWTKYRPSGLATVACAAEPGAPGGLCTFAGHPVFCHSHPQCPGTRTVLERGDDLSSQGLLPSCSAVGQFASSASQPSPSVFLLPSQDPKPLPYLCDQPPTHIRHQPLCCPERYHAPGVRGCV